MLKGKRIELNMRFCFLMKLLSVHFFFMKSVENTLEKQREEGMLNKKAVTIGYGSFCLCAIIEKAFPLKRFLI